MGKKLLAVVGFLLTGMIGLPGLRSSARAADTYTFSTINAPDSSFTAANGIDVHGRSVGQYVNSAGTHGFLLANGVFSTIDYPGATWTAAYGPNTAGQIVGAYGQAGDSGRHGFLLSGGQFSSIEVPGSSDTVARGINNLSQIVGEYLGPDGSRHGFLLSGGNYATVEFPGSGAGAAGGINDSGKISGLSGFGPSGTGFLFASGSYSKIQAPDSNYTEPWGLNNLGDIVGQVGGPTAPYRGFRRVGDVYTTIDLPNFPFSWDARGISDLGEIVGAFTDNDGKTHGYRATPTALRTGPADPEAGTRLSEGRGVIGVAGPAGLTGPMGPPGPQGPVGPPSPRGGRGRGQNSRQNGPRNPLNAVRDALERASNTLERAPNQGNGVQKSIAAIGVVLDDVRAAIRNNPNPSGTAIAPEVIPNFIPPTRPGPNRNIILEASLSNLKTAFDALAQAPVGELDGLRTKINKDIATAAADVMAAIHSANEGFPRGRGSGAHIDGIRLPIP